MSSSPRRIGDSLPRIVSEAAPRTLLAEVQVVWPEACGEAIARCAEPVAERDGLVTVACDTGAWAQELELMQDQLLPRLGALVGEGRIRGLRFTADRSRHT